MNLFRRISGIFFGIIAFCCLIGSARAQYTPQPEIVSAWKFNADDIVLVFRYDGTFYFVDGDPEHPGVERGTFTWDDETGAFSVNTIVDTNGDAGFSHPGAATTVSISGNTLSYTVAGEGTYTFSRVVSTPNAIVGSWAIPGEKFSLTFLANGAYYLSDETNDIPFGHTGIEKGNFTWNSSTKAFTASATIDTNGDSGLDVITSGVTVNISGNTLVFDDGEDPVTLRRITTNPTPLRLPNFGTTRFANYRQSSSANPVLRTVADFSPYSADAFVDSEIGANAPTVKVGSSAPITIDTDFGGGFDIEEEFASLSALNSFLPASTAIQFKDGAATANLTTAASLTFPSVPKINVRGSDFWSGGLYRFGEDEVLEWTLPDGFVASQYVTILKVYDPVADKDVVDAEIQGDVTFFDLAGKLEPGKQYEVELEFYRIDGSTTAGTGVFAGEQGFVLSATSTVLNARSLPSTDQISITEQPNASTPSTGSPLLLTVGINDGAFRDATFQWFRNNQEIEGQTGNSLYIPNFNPFQHSGTYRVNVNNAQGATESDSVFIGSEVQFLCIHNRKIFQQQSPSLFVETGAAFDARVQGIGISNMFPASTISVRKPDNSSLPLALDEDHWDIETDFPSFAALRSSFPTGTYKLDIGGDIITIPFTGTAFPNRPVVSSSAGTWVNGRLRLTATEAATAFTLTTDSNSGNGWSTITVVNAADDEVVNVIFNTPENPSPAAVAHIGAGLLSVGQSYELEAKFDNTLERVDVSGQNWASPSAKGYELLSMATFLTIEVVADPVGAPYSNWQAGFFTSTQLANPAISGDDVDFDNDGIDNLIEFILGSSPTAGNASILNNATTTPAPGGRSLVFFYDRKTVANGITQVIETSPSLTGIWTSAVHGVNGVAIATTTLDGQTQRVTATIPSTETKLFVRLKATR